MKKKRLKRHEEQLIGEVVKAWQRKGEYVPSENESSEISRICKKLNVREKVHIGRDHGRTLTKVKPDGINIEKLIERVDWRIYDFDGSSFSDFEEDVFRMLGFK